MKNILCKWLTKLLSLIVLAGGISLTACTFERPDYRFGDDGKSILVPVSEGQMLLTVLDANAVRVQVCPNGTEMPMLEELIYTETSPLVSFRVRNRLNGFEIRTAEMRVRFKCPEEQLVFLDMHGRTLLSEKAGGRSISQGMTGSFPSLTVSQTFLSRPDEYMLGLGQFQDGYMNTLGLTRRLTQVNSQISIPMVLSNKGYGLLWNNYGLTDYNPSQQWVELQPMATEGQEFTVNATSTLGNVREGRRFNDFSASVEIPSDGLYSLLLDVGQSMARKHFLTVDGDTLVDVTNTWLPPTTSVVVHLTGGTHKLRVSGVRGDRPSVGIHSVQEDADPDPMRTTTFSSPVAVSLDYTVFAGNADRVINSYRNLTGKVPPMPEWAFGYIHCRERYHSQQEILENAARFRADSIPLDVIVQDWQWWGKYGWNAMQFDEDNYPDPKALTDSLHQMGVKLMLSVWSKIDRNCQVGQEMVSNGYYIDGTDWIDFFQPEAAAAYWKEFRERLLPTGIDAWWQDATEPENDDLKGRMVAGGTIPGEFYRNAYPNKVNQTVFNGLKQDQPDRQPMILTRSGFTGIQRYGAVNWSGDVGNDWETLRRQIAGGLSLMATGQPWWTYDAGGFFRPWAQYTDTAYQERMIRWIQASVFLPFMRVHGYMSQTEPWHYSAETQRIFVEQIKFRYKLMPYILECARRVSQENYTLMRPLLFDFPDDEEALRQQTEFMFGPDLLVCPITEPGVKEWQVYLPASKTPWRDIHTGDLYPSQGRYLTIPAALDRIPIFTRQANPLIH